MLLQSLTTTIRLMSFVIILILHLSDVVVITIADNGYIEAQPVALKELLRSPETNGYLQVEPDDATCGTGGGGTSETICSMADIPCYDCPATAPSRRHPDLALIVDDYDNGGAATFWQSSSWSSYPAPHHITITAFLKKDYRITDDIAIIFRDPLPMQWILEKSQDYGASWEVLEYYSTDCMSDFQMATKETNGFSSVTEVLCSNPYADAEAVTTGEGQSAFAKRVTFPVAARLNLLSANGNSEKLYTQLETDEVLRNYLRLTELRLRLLRPPTPGGSTIELETSELNKYNYGIYDISTQLSCECNLHGDYCSFVFGQVQCHCLHGTSGKNCQNCKIGHQLLPWQPASYLPFPIGTANKCMVEPGFSTEAPTQPPTQPTSVATEDPVSNSTTQGATTTVNTRTLEAQACAYNPCNGNGVCRLADTGLGFRCDCDAAFSGIQCETYNDPCNNDTCPADLPQCYSNGGLFKCIPADELPPGTVERTTQEPAIVLGPLHISTLTLIIVAPCAIILFFVLMMLLLWCTTWRHLHPTEKGPTNKYVYDPELNGVGNGDQNGFTNMGYGVVSQKIDPRDLRKFNGETFLVPDGVTSMKVGHVKDGWVIEEDKLDIGKLLHSGQFSYICEGVMKNKDSEQKVVVKLLRDETDIESTKELKNEFNVLANLGRHPNIMWLMGICYRTLDGTNQTCLLTQYVSRGDMLRILRRCRARRRDQEPFAPLPQDELLSFACDIAAGMRHLSVLKYVHRNLCAKNILITFNNKAKIADFGVATEIPSYLDFVYYKEPRNPHTMRWMAYEALLEGQYTTRCDVWSFGIVLWEIATLGGMPYPKMKTPELVTQLKAHHRMEWPKHCTTELYDLMLRCWHRRPESRPSFEMLTQELKKLRGSGKKQIHLKDYTFQMYVPVKLPEDFEEDTMDDSFV